MFRINIINIITVLLQYLRLQHDHISKFPCNHLCSNLHSYTHAASQYYICFVFWTTSHVAE